MEGLKRWWRGHKVELEQARRENRAAREAVAATMAKAQQEGATVLLSRAALERIGNLEQAR